MNQTEFLAITCNLLKARENRAFKVHYWFCFFISLVEKLAKILEPITKRSNRNYVITYLPYVLRFRTRGRS